MVYPSWKLFDQWMFALYLIVCQRNSFISSYILGRGKSPPPPEKSPPPESQIPPPPQKNTQNTKNIKNASNLPPPPPRYVSPRTWSLELTLSKEPYAPIHPHLTTGPQYYRPVQDCIPSSLQSTSSWCFEGGFEALRCPAPAELFGSPYRPEQRKGSSSIEQSYITIPLQCEWCHSKNTRLLNTRIDIRYVGPITDLYITISPALGQKMPNGWRCIVKGTG